MKFQKSHIVLFLVLSFQFLSFCQNQRLRQFSVEDGLPQSQVNDIAQDQNGYLWLATQGGGVARFDGDNFKIYNTSNGLLDNYVNALYVAKDTLFIGSKRGLSIKSKNRIYSAEAPRINKITRIKGVTFLLTNKGLFRFSGFVSDTSRPNIIKISLDDNLDKSRINDLIFDGEHYWIASKSGLFKTEDLFKPQLERLVQDNFVALLNYKNRVLAATASEGLFSFEPNRFQDAFLILEGIRINDISVQYDNEIWIATANKGIYQLNLETHEANILINSADGLAIQNVQKTMTDRQSNIWIASSGGGFYRYFQNNFKHYNIGSGPGEDRVYAVHANQDGLWFSRSTIGLSKIKKDEVKTIAPPEPFKNAKLKTIASDRKDNLYLGSEGQGIWLRFQKTRDTFIEDKRKIDELQKIKISLKSISDYEISTNTGFPYDSIRSISIQADTIWASTYASGIVKFSYSPILKEPLAIFKVFSTKAGILDLNIKHSSYQYDRLWYATQNGHLGFIKSDEVNHLGAVLGEEVAINSILIYNDLIFLGTAGRGIWWSQVGAQLSFKKLKGSKPLTSENSLQLIFDNQGYLWSGSERGVDKIKLNPDTEIIDVFHFGKNDGFSGIETCLNAIDKDESGRLWFGTINGLTEYVPTIEDSESFAPKLFIEELRVNLKTVDSLGLATIGQDSNILKLAPDQNQVSFSFKSVDLNHPNSIQYRTKWNDSEWTSWSSNSSRAFSGLSFGKHVFSVQARNYRWQKSEVKKVSVFIETPMYRKVWFQSLLAVFFLLMLTLISVFYVKRLKHKNKRQQHQLQIENHLLDLEQKALRLQMNPHFMFNVLNGIKAMAKTKPSAMNDTINDFAALLRSTLSSSRKESISLQEEIEALHHYIKLELQMAQKPFDYTINLNSDYAAEDIRIPPMLIQPFVENSIRHGVTKGHREGKLDVQFISSGNSLKVIISDNGIGVFESQKTKLATDHQSMALKVTRDRLQSITGRDALKIVELKDKTGKVIGTEVCFEIPLETDF